MAAAVLIRALEPLEGIDLMRERRGLERDEELCSGPGKLTQALGIGLDLNGSSLVRRPDPGARPRPRAPGAGVVAGERIGITKAVELPWRFADRRQPPRVAALAGGDAPRPRRLTGSLRAPRRRRRCPCRRCPAGRRRPGLGRRAGRRAGVGVC